MSDWTNYVKQYARQHGITYGEALSKAAPSYRRGGVVLGGKKKSKKSSKATKKSKKSISGSKKSYKKSPLSKKKSYRRRNCPAGKRKVCVSKPKIKKAYAVGKGLGEMFGGCNKGAIEALISGLVSKAR